MQGNFCKGTLPVARLCKKRAPSISKMTHELGKTYRSIIALTSGLRVFDDQTSMAGNCFKGEGFKFSMKATSRW